MSGATSSGQPADSKEVLFKALTDELKQAKERADSFVDRSQKLLGFAGLVNAVLVVIIVNLVTSDKVGPILKASQYRQSIIACLIIGVIIYSLAIFFALLAYSMVKYRPVPQIDSEDFINDVFSGKLELELHKCALQAFDAKEYYNEVNKKKYYCMYLATILLMVAIVVTGILGVFIALSFI